MLGILFWLAPHRSAIPRSLVQIQEYLPYLIIIPALLLCFAFRLTREFNQLLLLLIIYWVLYHFIWHNPYHVKLHKTSLLYLLAILFPVNLILHNVLKERGIISTHGLLRLGVAILQIVLILFLFWLEIRNLYQILGMSPLAVFKIRGLHLPPLAVLGFIIASMLVVVKAIIKPGALNINQFIFVIACFLLFQFARNELYASLFLSTAALSILIAILLNSYNLAYLDELTGLPSRRALKHQLATLGKRYCVAMLDIDHFKKLNDTYGHDVGDQILRMVASRIRKVPGANKAFRYGGEEFTVIFPNRTLDDAHVIAKRICEAIAKEPFVLRNKRRPRKKPPFLTKRRIQKKIEVTISIGVARKTARHPTAQETIKAADKALYRAKDTGRNRACT